MVNPTGSLSDYGKAGFNNSNKSLILLACGLNNDATLRLWTRCEREER